MPASRPARVCFYWPVECGKIVAYQHVDGAKETCINVGKTGKDPTDQPFQHRRFVVPGRPARLRLCQSIENGQIQIPETDCQLHTKKGKPLLPVCFDRFAPRNAEN